MSSTTKRLALKRKLKSASSFSSRKKAKVDGALNKRTRKSKESRFTTRKRKRGKVAKFKYTHDPSPKASNNEEPENQESSDEESDESADSEPEEELFDSETLLPEWHPLDLHPKLTRSIHARNFSKPTEIQKEAIPLALQGRDVVGVAQTGSGKTLAYGLPILHTLLNQKRPSSKRRRPLRALILAPTRELALQVSQHLTDTLKAIDPQEDEGDEKKQAVKPPPHVSVAAIVGGMSAQKQKRVLDRGVDVLIATPGRLWDIVSTDDNLANEIRNLRFLVLDEADRMIETGHFAELDNILRLTLRESSEDEIPGIDNEKSEDEDTNMDDKADDKPSSAQKGTDLQTFVFSATLSKDLQRNLKRRKRSSGFSKKKKREPSSTLDDLLLRLDFRDPEPEVIDLSPKGGVVSTLQEGRVNCLTADKDVYLFYFLLRHPGRTLVFLSSIDGIRRLNPLLELLNVKAFPLHSQMEQRQRLKNLDRFKSIPNSVLLATDVAARGLDIPSVDHVIHFQIPRTADTYIHRNGRTARASREGFSMLMCAPDERRIVKALMNSLGRDEAEIPELDLELSLLDRLKERVKLAKEIEGMQHRVKKGKFEKNWVKEAADALEVDLDSDFFSDEEDLASTKQQQKAHNAKLASLKAELKQMLAQPLVARGISAKYITSGSRPVVDDLLAGTINPAMIGVKQVQAREEVRVAKKPKKQQKKKGSASN
ncbi:ATP-dependent rRNA helicase RRP3 [Coprinopsis cinerea AmutBmut pab1-1]|nr:ATP-dependent rRNA helicase RRP3 [Coprinopsis cinerea AmutBmut pab1-1]